MIRGVSVRKQGGVALIVVLWLIVLLSVMAAGHTRNTHSDTLLAARQTGFVQARAFAGGGIRHAIAELLADTQLPSPPLDGTPYTIDIAGQPVTLAIRDVRGLVDLNAAGPALLASVLNAGGADEVLQSQLVDAILDWRDVDNLSHLNGAEDHDYKAAGLDWSARDGSFESVDELKYVLGLPQSLFDRVAPLVTVHSGRSGLDPRFAPAILTTSVADDLHSASGATVNSGRLRTGTYHIRAQAAGSAGAVATVEATVRLSASRNIPYVILEWRDPSRGPIVARTEDSE